MNNKITIIAEVGNLHNGDFDMAKKFIAEAARSGADVVKFQTHIFDSESLPEAPNPPYFTTESRKEYFKRTAFTKEQWKQLKNYAQSDCNVEFMSSIFSQTAFNMLEEIGVKMHKIPSGEVTNLPLLMKVAPSGKKVLLSSGMSTWSELDEAVNVLKNKGCQDLVVFQCSSIYPCPPKKVGLNLVTQIKERYNVPVGLSDHTLGCAASIATIMLGASFIEKHFTLSTDLYGSDAKHSLTPDQFSSFVKNIRELEVMLDSSLDKDAQALSLGDMKAIFEKSIVTKIKIEKGKKIIFDMIDFKKPGDGIKANRYNDILGKIAKVDIGRDTKIREDMLER